MKKLAVIALFSVSMLSAHADELMFHTVSFHTQQTYEKTTAVDRNVTDITGKTVYTYQETVTTTERYNGNNLGVGYRSDDGWTVGAYRNSYKRTTVYGALAWQITPELSGLVGVASGYQEVTGHPLTPFVALQYRIALSDHVHLNTIAIPPSSGGAGVVHFALSKDFK